MEELRALRNYLDQHFPHAVNEEPTCTCGAANHARVCFFRVSHQPAAAVLPEGAKPTADELRNAIGPDVEALDAAELEATYTNSELGHMQPFENPFGATVFLDESLLRFPELVFCPRMFFGERGECFRVPTKEFLELTHAIVAPLTVPRPSEPDYWAV